MPDPIVTPFVCAHLVTRVELLPDTSPHYAKRVCADCGAYLQFEPKPTTTDKPKRANSQKSLLNKYSQGYCELCLCDLAQATGGAAAHHVVEHQEGGSAERENIWILCAGCHRLVHWARKWKAN